MNHSRRRMTIDARTVRERARGGWIGILGRLAPTLEPALARPGRHVPCPVHGGSDGFRVFRDVAETGGGICNSCGPRRDGFALLMWANAWGFRETLEAVAQDLGLDTGHPRTIAARPRPVVVSPPVNDAGNDAVTAAAALRRVWFETLDPDDRRALPLRRYLYRRGIDAELDPRVLRFHPGLAYYDGTTRIATFPALVAKVSDAEGRSVSLHRIYLDRAGHKAPVAHPKKMMPPIGTLCGGAVRLYPAGATLGITEGIETALVIRQRTAMPVWAGISATLLQRFVPPPGVELVVIWADLDRSGTGEQAALALRERLVSRGIRAALHLPKGPIPEGSKSLDWCDLWRLDLPAAA
ncbi:DUF7146 domain-containing protein [Thiocapsa marina]|uniref:p4 alpha zinc-binding domain protein n=1 Tax=Thiocapsa marina 5811 TaxID=768671 RepID=F9UHU4_9GAMM|nr:toprim domain-containing protein [Thiocapsa marina]EGV16270.1 P4 alpha zinc-binding domain protein [Thiocapsa marina 5811]